MKLTILLLLGTCSIQATESLYFKFIKYSERNDLYFDFTLRNGDVLKKVYFINNFKGDNRYIAVERKNILLKIGKEHVKSIKIYRSNCTVLINNDVIDGIVNKVQNSTTINNSIFGTIKLKNRHVKTFKGEKVAFRNKTKPTKTIFFYGRITIDSEDIEGIRELTRIVDLRVNGFGEKFDINKILSFKKLKLLTIRNLQIENTKFDELSQLGSLIIEKSSVKELSLENHSKLVYLILRNNIIENLTLKNLDLSSLKIESNKIKNVENIEKIPKLRYLFLDSNSISNIKKIANLNLISLRLNNCSIKNYSFIKKLSTLSELKLSNCNLKDISFLNNHHNLINLDLSNNSLNNLSFLSKLKVLKELNLSNNNLKNILSLRKMQKLEKLNLSNNKLKDLNNIDKCLKLKSLNLSNNKIINLKALNKLPVLEKLNLSNSNLTDLSIIPKLLKLEELNLSNNNLQDLKGIDRCSQISNLDVSFNKLTKLDAIQKLIELRTLNVSYNKLSNLKGLEKIKYIYAIYINNNNITDISLLGGLSMLGSVDLSNNKINSILPLAKNKYISEMYINDNPIDSISVVAGFKYLYDLDISNTLIKDISMAKKTIRIKALNTPLTTTDLRDFKCREFATNSSSIKFPRTLERLHLDITNKDHLQHALNFRLKYLSFENSKGDFSFVGKLHPCTILNFNNTNFDDLSLLENQRYSLKKLIISNSKVQDFSFLKNFIVLNTVYVSLPDDEYKKLQEQYPKFNIHNNKKNRISKIINNKRKIDFIDYL